MPIVQQENRGDAAEFFEDEIEPQKLCFLYANVTDASKICTVTPLLGATEVKITLIKIGHQTFLRTIMISMGCCSRGERLDPIVMPNCGHL